MKFWHQISLVLGVMTLSACGGGSSSDTKSATDSCNAIGLGKSKIANGETCSAGTTPDQTSIVRLTINIDSETGGTCTGVLLNQKVVLTAAHCFNEGADGGIVVDTFVGSTNASSYLIAPGYIQDYSPSVNDMALVFLDSEIPAATTPILVSRAPSIGENAVIAGYGENAPDVIDEFIRAGSAQIVNVTPSHVFISFQGNQSHPCRGDSGGPLLVTEQGSLAIAGVVSQSDPQVAEDNICKPGDVTLYTNTQLPNLFQFIVDHVPDVATI